MAAQGVRRSDQRFNFNAGDYAFPTLPDTAALAAAAATECKKNLPAATPIATTTAPTQETGPRPARVQPYQLNGWGGAERSTGRYWVYMTNHGPQDVMMTAYVNAYRTDGPWRYQVTGDGVQAKDYFSVNTYGGGKYDISCMDPTASIAVLPAISAPPHGRTSPSPK